MIVVGDYMCVKCVMDIYCGDKYVVVEVVVQEWLKYVCFGFVGKDKVKVQELFELMYDVMIVGVDFVVNCV